MFARVLLSVSSFATLLAGQDDLARPARRILAEHCFACHGPDGGNRMAGLRLDTREGALAGGRSGPAIVPGDPANSRLVQRIRHEDPEERMPPADAHRDLDAQKIDLLTAWVASGADYVAHWAYEAPRRTPRPTVQNAKWVRSFVDTWILAGMERAGVEPAPAADRVTLLRRLSFDLTGLPPTDAVAERFLSDRAGGAVDRLVDVLLDSPHFGERLATYWLDLVRYADTVGYHGDQSHAISPYRDWVIAAFNANMPFDQFTRDQLAGDLVAEPEEGQLIASGYNRVLQTTHEGGAQAKEYLAIYAADRVRNLGTAWLGLTTGCAQCHDHKFDPITQRDFYSLAAFFADVQEKGDFAGSPNRDPTTRPPEIKTADGRQAMVTNAVKPRMTRLLARGDWMDESGEVVQPVAPHFLPPIRAEGRATRLDLARWLTRADHPLTARVFVNRLWYLFFGRGLSDSLEDLGVQGAAPTHPELLDELALEFVESGWDVKHIVRAIVTSSAYRQSSLPRDELREIDPSGDLLARQGRWRLDAEFVRDNALLISGLLIDERGGQAVKPYQPAGYYQHLNFPPRQYKHHADQRQWRRGVYVHWQRQFLHPQLLAFDAPTREEGCARRMRSNTPQAALTLLNDPTFVEAARVFATQILELNGGDARRLRWAFERATTRKPDSREIGILQRLLRSQRKFYRQEPAAVDALMRVGQAAVPDDVRQAELAAWTAVARAILNLSETNTRN